MRAMLTALLAGSMTCCVLTLALGKRATGATTVSDVLVSTANPLVVTSDPGYALRYRRDGVATYDGRLAGRDGHYESPVEFDQIERLVGDSKLCERNGVSTFIEASASSSGIPHVLITVRCGSETKLFNDAVAQDVPAVATALLEVARGFHWRYRGAAQRQTLARLAR